MLSRPAALFVLALASLPAWPQAPQRPAIETRKVDGTENVYIFRNVNHQAMFIVTPAGVIATDPVAYGRPQGGAQYVAEIRKVTSAPIRYLIYSHHHFDHIAGGQAFKDAGATIIAHRRAKERLELLKDPHTPLPDEVVDERRTISLGGTTLRALHTPGHTQGATTWITTVQDKGRTYTVGFLGGTTPNGGVPLFDNPRHRNVIEDTQRTFKTLKAEKVPDIYLVGHPQAMFAGKVERIKAGETPHPLLNGEAWTKQIVDGEAGFAKRVAEERAKLKR